MHQAKNILDKAGACKSSWYLLSLLKSQYSVKFIKANMARYIVRPGLKRCKMSSPCPATEVERYFFTPKSTFLGHPGGVRFQEQTMTLTHMFQLTMRHNRLRNLRGRTGTKSKQHGERNVSDFNEEINQNVGTKLRVRSQVLHSDLALEWRQSKSRLLSRYQVNGQRKIQRSS